MGGLDPGRAVPWAILDLCTTWTLGGQELGPGRTLEKQEPVPGWTLEQAGPGVGRIVDRAEHRARLYSEQTGPQRTGPREDKDPRRTGAGTRQGSREQDPGRT